MKKYLIITPIILFHLLSCNRENNNFTYKGNLIISVNSSLNDSIIEDKTFECYAYVDMKKSTQKWSKYLFYREYEKLDEPVAIIMDTSFFKLKVDEQFQIEKILNWNQFYKKYKNKVYRYIETFPKEQRASISPFIESVAFDSLLIVSKNLKDIQLFNYGLKYLQNPQEVKKGMKIKIKGDITELTGTELIEKENLDYSISKLSENLPIQNENKEIGQPKINYLIVIDNKKKEILYAEQTTLMEYGKDTLKHIIKINQSTQDISKW